MAAEETVRFRPGLLAGQVVVLASGSSPFRGLAHAGAEVVGWRLDELGEEAAAEAAARAALTHHGHLDALVFDGAYAFGAHGLRATLDRAWNVVRAVATAAFIPDARGGKVALLAPAPDAGPHAEAARAGLENMARTLSIEWARFGVRLVAVTPGAQTTPVELDAVLAYLVSPAGDYFSGCRLALGEATPVG